MLFIIDNSSNFQTVSEVHGPHTKSRTQLFIPNTNLTSVEKCYKAALLREDDKKNTLFYIFNGYIFCRHCVVEGSFTLCEVRCTRQK